MPLFLVDTYREKHTLGKSQTVATEKAFLEVEEDIHDWKEKESNCEDE